MVSSMRRGAAVLLAGLGGLSACNSGSGTAGIPITLQGATIWQETGDAATQAVRAIEGGDGGDFRGVIFIDDGFFEFLQEETGAGGGEVVFFQDANNQARLFEPATSGSDDYETIRFINLRYSVGADTYQQLGYIGRATTLDNMSLATGTATYVGNGTVDVIVQPISGDRLDFLGGDTAITADFGSGSVDVLLNGVGLAAWEFNKPYDEFRITGMTIDGNTFRGGTFTALKNGTQVATFPGDFQATGFFAGFNDGTGNVTGGDVPGEASGAFRADSAADGVAFGYFAGD